jgi:hypothetical protein
VLEAAHAAVERFVPGSSAEARYVVLEEPVGMVLFPGDPLDIDPQVFLEDQVLDQQPLLQEGRSPRLLLARKVPDHNLAVGLNPGRCVVGNILKGKDDRVELGLIIGCAALVGEKDFLLGEQRHRVAVTAPVNQDIDPVRQRGAPDRRSDGKMKIKRIFGSAREGHSVHRPLPSSPFTMQPVIPSGVVYQRISLPIFNCCAPFLKIPALQAGFNNYRAEIR